MEEQELNFIQKHPRVIFWFRFVAWVLFGAVLPFLFIAFSFNIFKKMSAFSLSGWGIIAIIIIAAFIIRLVKYLRKGFSKKSVFAKQCIDGICQVIIPLIALYALIKISVTNLQLFLQALGCVILCELIAIPLNPMPAWVEKCKKDSGDEEARDVVDYIESEKSAE